MTNVNVYLDYGRTFFPEDVDALQALSGKRKVFRWAYKAASLGPNVYRIGVCNEHTRDDCKAAIRDTFRRHGFEPTIIPSVEGIR